MSQIPKGFIGLTSKYDHQVIRVAVSSILRYRYDERETVVVTQEGTSIQRLSVLESTEEIDRLINTSNSYA